MTLLNKLGGLALVSALFFACEEPTELGANLNPLNNKIGTHYVEIPVDISQVKIDSIVSTVTITSQRPKIYLGRTQDDNFGTQKASGYLTPFRPNIAQEAIEGAKFISATLSLVYDEEPFGAQITNSQSFGVYRLANKIDPKSYTAVQTGDNSVVYVNYENYIGEVRNTAESITVGGGEYSFDINAAISNPPADKDTTLEAVDRLLTIELSEVFGKQMLNYILNDDDYNQEGFNEIVKGIAIVPGENNTYINSYSVTNANSGIYLKYSIGTDNDIDSLLIRFTAPADPDGISSTPIDTVYQAYPSYYSIESNFAGTPLAISAIVDNRQDFTTSDENFYYQPFTGIYPKVIFPEFDNFINSDSVSNIVINKAILELDSVQVYPESQTIFRQPIPINNLDFLFVENNNRFYTATSRSGLERSLSTVTRSLLVETSIINYYQSDILFPLELYLQSGNPRYLQGVYYKESIQGNNLFEQLTKYDLARFKAKKDQLKLKIWYTNFTD